MKTLRYTLAALTLAAVTHGGSTAAESIVIRQATVDTMTGVGRLEQADVLIVDGTIRAIGEKLPGDNSREIDGRGKFLTPGVFNAFTQIGTVEIDGIKQTRDTSASNENFTASLSPVDSFNPHSTLIPQNRIHGVTRAIIAPIADDSLFAGQLAVANLSASVTDSIEVASLGVLVNYNEYAQEAAGGSRSAALATIRRALADALDYNRERPLYQAGDGRELSLSLDDMDALIPIVTGEQHLFVNVSRSTDILKILELGEQFSLKMVLVGAQEGWMVANNIAQASVPVILDPIDNLPQRFETLGARLENAALLHQAGVTLMFKGMGWQNTHNAFLVTQAAGVAVSYGLPYEAALAALFSNPATVFGLQERGQIAIDATADLVLWSNDPLELLREVEWVMVNGQEMPLVSRSTRLRDRYYSRIKASMEE